MASKFQNRLVGTVILVALGVIILPGLLDGKKKHYKDEFAAIPLIPKPGDVQEINAVPPINPALPVPSPESVATALATDKKNDSISAVTNDVGNVVLNKTVSSKSDNILNNNADNRVSSAMPGKTAINQPIEKKPPASPFEVKPQTKLAPAVKTMQQPEEKAPVGQAYVVQLGALKNADKVNEIVAKLRLSGHRAYTVPPTPIQDQITRIMVGPDVSKQKLESVLSELNALSGLNGQVKPYNTKR